MTVRLIILNWNGRRWLERCLAAVAAQTYQPTEVVVVDNGSTDGSVEYVRASWPKVIVVSLETNAGFAAGNNHGARGAATDALVFLNNDTEAEAGWLESLVVAAQVPGRDVVTSRIVFLDRPDVVDSAGDGYLRCGGGFKRGHGQPAAAFTMSGEVFGACGAAFLMRRSLFERLGGFDESFFMVYEDVDLSYRARLAGARVWYAADAVVRHAGSASLGRASASAVFYGQRNLEWTWLKNTPAGLWWRSLPAHVAYNVAGALVYARQRRFLAWLKGKAAAITGLPGVLKSRRQNVRSAAPAALEAVMTRGWVRVKREEKRFALRPLQSVEDDRSPDE